MQACPYLPKRRPRTPFLGGSGSGNPKCVQITVSNLCSSTSEPSTTIFSPTITAGAAGSVQLEVLIRLVRGDGFGDDLAF